MKILKFCLLLTAIGLFVFACTENKPTNSNTAATNKPAANTNTAASTQPTAAADEFAETKKIYTEKCVRCHKPDGTGGETVIDGEKIKAPNFTSDRLKKAEDADFIETIEKGATEDGMPAFKGKIPDNEIKNLVKMIRKEFQKQ